MRLLVLLRCADKRGRTPKPVEGITKLAKLDFLLRYPVYLERALVARGKSPDAVHLSPRERTTVETRMIRFRYGPWDGRYRRWLSLLSARGLVTLSLSGRKIEIGLTDAGRAAPERVADLPAEVLVAAGLATADPIVYEDFLPVSAAGIFQSNLGDDEQRSYAASAAQAA
ncbi:hypothetical protein LTR94_025312, partial [Friedmanniomyces endolithicus]